MLTLLTDHNNQVSGLEKVANLVSGSPEFVGFSSERVNNKYVILDLFCAFLESIRSEKVA